MIPIDGLGGDWVRVFFVEKAELFLRVLNQAWARAEREAGYIARLLERLGVPRGSLLLDVGCGNGRIAINLAKHGYRVVGVDVSPVFIRDAVARARENGVEDRVEFVVGDARRLDPGLVGGRRFDAALMYWTTLIGYYDEETDKAILRNIYGVVKPGGYLLILNQACLESAVFLNEFCGGQSYLVDLGDGTVMAENPRFDPVSATLSTTWVFYEKKGRDLRYIDEVSLTLRLYTMHELVEMAGEAGWRLHSAYDSLATLSPYRTGARGLNLVFVRGENGG